MSRADCAMLLTEDEHCAEDTCLSVSVTSLLMLLLTSFNSVSNQNAIYVQCLFVFKDTQSMPRGTIHVVDVSKL